MDGGVQGPQGNWPEGGAIQALCRPRRAGPAAVDYFDWDCVLVLANARAG